MKRAMSILCLTLLLAGGFVLTPARAQFYNMKNPVDGKPAPGFELPLLSGEVRSLHEYRGDDAAVIFFWATWCPHCRVQLAELQKNKDDILAAGIKLVIIDLGENPETVRAYINNNGIELDVFMDIESTLAEPYGLIGVPTFFIVDKEGTVIDVRHDLPDDWDAIFQS